MRLFFVIMTILGIASSGYAGEIYVKNCSDIILIGLAKFNDDMTDYEVFETHRVGAGESKNWVLEPGKYCVTYYNPLNNSFAYDLPVVTEDSKDSINFHCD